MRSAKRVPSSLSVFGQYRIPLIRTEDDAWAEFAMVDGMQRRASGADAVRSGEAVREHVREGMVARGRGDVRCGDRERAARRRDQCRPIPSARAAPDRVDQRTTPGRVPRQRG